MCRKDSGDPPGLLQELSPCDENLTPLADSSLGLGAGCLFWRLTGDLLCLEAPRMPSCQEHSGEAHQTFVQVAFFSFLIEVSSLSRVVLFSAAPRSEPAVCIQSPSPLDLSPPPPPLPVATGPELSSVCCRLLPISYLFCTW